MQAEQYLLECRNPFSAGSGYQVEVTEVTGSTAWSSTQTVDLVAGNVELGITVDHEVFQLLNDTAVAVVAGSCIEELPAAILTSRLYFAPTEGEGGVVDRQRGAFVVDNWSIGFRTATAINGAVHFALVGNLGEVLQHFSDWHVALQANQVAVHAQLSALQGDQVFVVGSPCIAGDGVGVTDQLAFAISCEALLTGVMSATLAENGSLLLCTEFQDFCWHYAGTT
ncbi:hypothetical protein D3C85_880670 [compost metagenome]